MSRRDRAVDRDADEAAVRDEVDEFLAGLTQTWSSTGVDARATTRPDSPGRALEPVDDVLGLRSPVRVQNRTADYRHRPAVDDEVREALARLPEKFQEALMMFVYEQLSYEEIAAVLGRPIGTVRSRIARARKLLQAELARLEEKPS